MIFRVIVWLRFFDRVLEASGCIVGVIFTDFGMSFWLLLVTLGLLFSDF